MMATWTICILLVIVHAQTGASAPSATYTCFEEGGIKKMKFILNPDSTTFMEIYAEGAHDTCSKTTGQITAVGSNFEVTVNLGTQITACNVQSSSAGGKDTYTMAIITVVRTVLRTSDLKYPFSCVFPDALTVSSTGTITPSSIVLTPGTAAAIDYAVTIEALDSSDQIITQAALGDSIKLKISVDTSKGALGVLVKECMALSADGTQTLLLTDDTGCPVGEAKDANIFPERFKPASGTTQPAFSGLFDLFSFVGSNTVEFNCEVELCFVADEAKCLSPTVCGAFNPGRKKRAAPSDEQVTANLSTSINICTGPCPQGVAGRSVAALDLSPAFQLGILVTLACALLVSIGISCATCWCYLRMRRKCKCDKQRKHTHDKHLASRGRYPDRH